MPVYEYECEDCLYGFDVKQNINSSPLTRCPECEGKVHRVIQAIPFSFKQTLYHGNPNICQAPEGHWVKER